MNSQLCCLAQHQRRDGRIPAPSPLDEAFLDEFTKKCCVADSGIWLAFKKTIESSGTAEWQRRREMWRCQIVSSAARLVSSLTRGGIYGRPCRVPSSCMPLVFVVSLIRCHVRAYLSARESRLGLNINPAQAQGRGQSTGCSLRD